MGRSTARAWARWGAIGVVLAGCARRVPVEPVEGAPGEVGLIGLATADGLRTLRVTAGGLAPVGFGVLRPREAGLYWLDVQTVVADPPAQDLRRAEGRAEAVGGPVVASDPLSLDVLRVWAHGEAPPDVPAPSSRELEVAEVELRFVGPSHVGLRSSGFGTYGGPHVLRWNHLLVLPWPDATWSAAASLRTAPPGKGAQPVAIDGLLGERAGAAVVAGEDGRCEARSATTWAPVHRDGRWVVEAGAVAPSCGGTLRAVEVEVELGEPLTGHAPVAPPSTVLGQDEVWSPGGLGVRVWADRVVLVRGGQEVAAVPWADGRIVSVAWTDEPAQAAVWAALGEP